MSDMFLKDLNIENILKLASIRVDQITCIECCKYYSVASTATCGHTLCLSCWRMRKTCPSCGLEIDKEELTFNVDLQILREKVFNFVQAFEHLFNVKFEDFWSNKPAKNESEDPNKNAKAWLTSSENHFSAPVTDSQQSTLFQSMEQALDQTSKQITSHIQIHSLKERISKLSDVIHMMPQQNDWDKIEEMSEIENNQENSDGSLDFDFLENYVVYTPRSKNNDIEIQKVNLKDKLTDIKESTNENNNSTIMINTEQDSISSNKSTANNTSKLTPKIKISEKENHIQNTLKNTQPTVSKTFRQVDPPKVCFFKKGALNKSFDKTVNPTEIPIDQNEKSDKLTCNTDDVEISTKIGGTIININIKKKENDVQLKIHSDRETQTSFINLVKEKNNTSCTPTHTVTERQNINSQNNNNLIINEVASATEQNMEKFTPSKMNTASADTNTKNAAQQITKKLDSIPEDLKFFNYEDIEKIFKSVNFFKEANIRPFQISKNTPSAILKCTMESNKTKSQKEKRDRDCTESEELTNNKKRKISNNDSIIDDNLKKKPQPTAAINVMEQDSENMNYAAIMSQVFANIDADMGKLPSSKFSENIFSLSKGGQDSEIFVTSNFKTFEDKENTKNAIGKPYGELESMSTIRKENKKQLSQTPDLDIIELSTPVHDEDSDKSVVEGTPQKPQSFTRNQNRNEALMRNTQQSTTKVLKPTQINMGIEDGTNIISLSDTMEESTKRSENVTVVETKRPTLETPLNITKFVDQIKHKSTPVARKSLNFASRRDDDPEQILCPSTFVAAKTTQEKEFLSKAFNQSLNSPTQTITRRRTSKLCVAGSCLTIAELANVKFLCSQRKWTFVDKYAKDLTHLVVGVDEENKSQRSVKYMCALAGAKWIVSYTWVKRCLETNSVLDEEAFEALDGTGEPGPRRSRLSKQKLFEGITFYCMPPFNVLDIETLKDILQWAGGRVVEEERAARAGPAPALLLAEPEHAQVDRLIYLAMELEVVPVNYEWVLNCLGSYTVGSIHELLLCPASLLPKVTAKWPSELMSYDNE